MNTHERYKQALHDVADGAADPQAIAEEALRSRKPVCNPVTMSLREQKSINAKKRKLNFALRAEDIHYRYAWGESRALLAAEYNISVPTIASIINEQRRIHERRYNRCLTCGHSGSMHHNEKWEYSIGPCTEYKCSCPAMDAGHD